MQEKEYIDNQITWLRTYIDAEVSAVRMAVDKVEKTNKEAVDKVETNNANYRATQNEWRGQIKDTNQLFVTRRELWSAVIIILTFILSGVAIMVNLKK